MGSSSGAEAAAAEATAEKKLSSSSFLLSFFPLFFGEKKVYEVCVRYCVGNCGGCGGRGGGEGWGLVLRWNEEELAQSCVCCCLLLWGFG